MLRYLHPPHPMRPVGRWGAGLVVMSHQVGDRFFICVERFPADFPIGNHYGELFGGNSVVRGDFFENFEPHVVSFLVACVAVVIHDGLFNFPHVLSFGRDPLSNFLCVLFALHLFSSLSFLQLHCTMKNHDQTRESKAVTFSLLFTRG